MVIQTRPRTRLLPALYAEEIYAFGTPQNVSTLTTLLNWTDLGSDYAGLSFHIENRDGTNNVTLIVEASQGASKPNDRKQTYLIPANSEGSIEIGPPNLYTYYRVSAQTDSPVFPTVSIRWGVLGVPR